MKQNIRTKWFGLTLTAAHQAEDINRLLEVLHGHSE